MVGDDGEQHVAAIQRGVGKPGEGAVEGFVGGHEEGVDVLGGVIESEVQSCRAPGLDDR